MFEGEGRRASCSTFRFEIVEMTIVMKGGVVMMRASRDGTSPAERTVNAMLDPHLKPRAWLVRATVLAVSLGLIHVLATPLYFEQWLGYGVFFFTAAVLQVMYGMALAVSPPSRGLLWLGITGNAAVFGLWALTRTVGVPFGPMAGEVLPLGLLDGLGQILVIAQIVHLAALLQGFERLGGRPLVE
jgi:hypothetical protein